MERDNLRSAYFTLWKAEDATYKLSEQVLDWTETEFTTGDVRELIGKFGEPFRLLSEALGTLQAVLMEREKK
jgi:hypothetical protein